MTDWRTIDVRTHEGRQTLRRVIAERLGYTVKRLPVHLAGEGYNVYTPDGKATIGWVGKTETEAWVNALKDRDGEIEGQGSYAIPDYPNDLNAAASLPYAGHWIDVRRFPDGYAWVTFGRIGEDAGRRVDLGGKIDVPSQEALARCLAWLAYMDAKGPSDG